MIARISGFHCSFIRCLAFAVLVTAISASAAVVNVSVVNNSFQPASVTIQVNDEVTWTWAPADGLVPHTTTSDTPGLWDSGVNTQPFDFTQPFPSAGTFPYHCIIHGGMVGTVTVEGTSSLPPVITTQPTSRTVNAGETTTFSVVATGTAPLSYQWRKDIANIPGANAASFTLNAVTSGDAGSYTVVVTNMAGSVTSDAAVLTVNAGGDAPAITTQPASQTVVVGQPVTFNVVATGTAPLSYQWRKDTANIPGANAASLTLNAVTVADAGSYTVVVTNMTGSVTSAAAVLTVNAGEDAPAITTQPASQTVVAGQPVTFNVIATGTAPLSYQWRKDTANIPGANAASLTLNAVTVADAGSYTVVVTNMTGSVTSAAAVLTVNAGEDAPAITTQPASQTVVVGQPVTFNVVATGTAPLSYQWRKDIANIPGANAASFTLNAVTSGDAGSYTVVVTNMTGSVTSAAAVLTVNAGEDAPAITTQPASQTVVVGQTATFTVVATGTAPLSYQWKRNGADVAGANSATLTLNGASIAQAGTYQVAISNSVGGATSAGATLTVNPVSPGALVEVQVSAGTFTPKVVNVNPGDVVRWSNPATGDDHTTTSGSPCTPDGLWNENLPGGATAEFQFMNAGTFPYFCVPHCTFGMTGAVVVLPPQEIPVSFGGVTRENGTNLVVDWVGGKGPFVLQRRASLTDLTWQNVTVTTQLNATVPITGASGFLRVYDSGKQPAIPFTVYMSGALERPTPVTTTGTGSGTLSLEGNTLTFNITYSGLSGNAAAAHIHGPATASAFTNVLINLVPFSAGALSTQGVFSGSVVLTDAQKAIVMAGQTYANVHTGTNPDGEIRGQIAPVLMQAELSSANERPDPVEGPAHGLGILQLVGNQLTMNVTYEELSAVATASHVHGPASASVPAGVLQPLDSLNGGAYGTSGSLSGTLTLTDDQLAHVVDGLTYINFHTANHLTGELRGQILPQVAGIPLTATLSSASETSPDTNALGGGSASFSLEGDNLLFSIAYSNLTGAAIGVHIHGPATNGQSTGVIIDLHTYSVGPLGTNGTLVGSVVVTSEQRGWLLAGLTYVNFHTPTNTAGEIRGQIAPVLMRATLNGANEVPTPIVTTATGSGTFTLVRDQLGFNIAYRDLSSTANNAHIHGPASPTQSIGVLESLVPYKVGDWGTNGSLAGRLTLSSSGLAYVIDGVTYVNVHSVTNSSGEIRGQITR